MPKKEDNVSEVLKKIVSGITLNATDLNGIIVVGLSGTDDGQLAVKDRLHVLVDSSTVKYSLAEKAAVALSHFEPSPELDDDWNLRLDSFVVACIANKYYGDSSVSTSDIVIKNTIELGAFADSVSARLTKVTESFKAGKHLEEGIKVAFATKVNFWLMNHHTGVGDAHGYAGKLVSTLISGHGSGLKRATSALWDKIHQVGHFIDTRHTYAKWFPGYADGAGKTFKDSIVSKFPGATDDLMLRLRSWPAGCAKASFAIAVMQRTARSEYGLGFTCAEGMMELARKCKDIDDKPWAYHVGGIYLCGQCLKVEPDEEVLAECSAYIHVVTPKGTLAASKACMSLDSVKSLAPEAEMHFKAIKAAYTASSKQGSTKAEAIIKARMMGSNNVADAAMRILKGIAEPEPKSST